MQRHISEHIRKNELKSSQVYFICTFDRCGSRYGSFYTLKRHILEKHPVGSRQMSRTQEPHSQADTNPLIFQMEDDLPQTASMVPVLYVRGDPLQNSQDCVIRWNVWIIPVGQKLKIAFNLFLETLTAFNVPPAPTDKHFFLFLHGAIFHTATLSTTGAKFLHSL